MPYWPDLPLPKEPAQAIDLLEVQSTGASEVRKKSSTRGRFARLSIMFRRGDFSPSTQQMFESASLNVQRIETCGRPIWLKTFIHAQTLMESTLNRCASTQLCFGGETGSNSKSRFYTNSIPATPKTLHPLCRASLTFIVHMASAFDPTATFSTSFTSTSISHRKAVLCIGLILQRSVCLSFLIRTGVYL
jgi:hypothetical protein